MKERPPFSVLALDIGGANLKGAHSGGAAALQSFELWKDPARLPDALGAFLLRFPPFDALAVTMTGELCDCFESKRQGVQVILDAVDSVGSIIPIRVWRNDGRLVSLEEARTCPLRVAATNWLALATYSARLACAGLLLDIGSTTTDIIPFFQGKPQPLGLTDPERLRSRELVYTGTRRTPVCTLLGLEGAAEFFASTEDVYLILGHLNEQPLDRRTADARPATVECAHSRLARMLCADRETCSAEIQVLAEEVRDRQLEGIRQGLRKVAAHLPQPPEAVVIAGSGEFLARLALAGEPPLTDVPVISLADKFGTSISEAACAYALMRLAAEQMGSSPLSPEPTATGDGSGLKTSAVAVGSGGLNDRWTSIRPTVVKVGGSLYDLPDLGSRLRAWLASCPATQVVLVPGGGTSVDHLRLVDKQQHLGAERAHWLALQAMSFNARLLEGILQLPGLVVSGDPPEFPVLWRQGKMIVLDAYLFCQGDRGRLGELPCSWDVTSDSVAARVAEVVGAERLVLLKSVDIPEVCDWETASQQGHVDRYFAQIAARAFAKRTGAIGTINFRRWQPAGLPGS
jgi:probable H4MPT-linked C1 transfer pathway protein